MPNPPPPLRPDARPPNLSSLSSPAAPLPPHAPYVMTVPQKLYLWLTAFFVASLLVADMVGIRLFRIPLPWGVQIPIPWSESPITAIEHTCGMLTFPVTFLLTDLINEYYGKRGARRVTLIGFSMGVFVFLVINASLAMPRLDAPYNVREDAFRAVFANSRLMFVASLCAFLIGQLSDIAIFGALKRATRGKMLWLRATGSTVLSQAIDSFLVSWIAFGIGRRLFPDPSTPAAPLGDILKIAATGYLLKFVIAIAITPLIYAGHGIFEKWFGLKPMPPTEK